MKTLLLKKDLPLQQPSENITKSIFKFDDELIGQLKINPDNEVKEGVNEAEADVKTNLELVDLVSESSTTQTKEQGTELIADEKCIHNKNGTPKVPPSDVASVQKVGTPQTPLTAAIQKVGTPRTPLTAFIRKETPKVESRNGTPVDIERIKTLTHPPTPPSKSIGKTFFFILTLSGLGAIQILRHQDLDLFGPHLPTL